MATSGSRNFQSTCDEIIASSMQLVGAVASGVTAQPAELAQARTSLNMIVQSLHTRGVAQLWARERRSTALVSGTATYVLGQDVLEIMAESVALRNASNLDTKLLPMNILEYQEEGQKSLSGIPTRFLLEPNQSYTDAASGRTVQGRLQLVLHPVPNASTFSMIYVATRKLQDFDAATNDADSPPKWMRCLVYGLAAELAMKYGLQTAERRELRAEFEAEVERLRKDDVPRGNMRFSVRLPSWGR
jgi:hypothetical protein